MKRRQRRKSMRRRRRSKNIRRQSGDAKRFFKIRAVYDIKTAGTLGVITSGVTDDPSSAQDWTNIAGLFDMYRVCGIKLKFIPDANTKYVATGITETYKPLYIVYDPDSTSNPLAGITDAIQYENCKFKNMLRPWSYYHKMNRTLAESGNQIHDTKGYGDSSNPQPNQGIWWYGEGFNLSDESSYGTLLVTYYVAAKNRK